MINNPDERRRRIMAAVEADEWDDVDIEIKWAVFSGLADDLAGTADRPPLPSPRRMP